MTPSFLAAQQAGTNLANSFSRVNDENAIESILSQAMQSGNPEDLQKSIGQILSKVSPERQGVAVQYLQNAHKNLVEKQKEAKEQMGLKELGLENVPKDMRETVYKERERAKSFEKTNQLYNNPQGQAPQTQEGQIPNQPPQRQQPQTTEEYERRVRNQLNSPRVEDRERAKGELKAIDNAKKQIKEDERAQRKEVIEFHKESQKYDDEVFKQYKTAKGQIDTLKGIKKNIQSGNITPWSFANIFKHTGVWGDKIANAFLNKDSSALLSSIPQLLEGWKEVFGVRLTDADLRLLQDKLPSIEKSPEANMAVVNILTKYANATLLRGQIADQIKKENNGLRPLGYANLIENRYDEATAPVKMISPGGNVVEIPAYQVSDAIRKGGKLANE